MKPGEPVSRETLMEFPCDFPIKVFGPAVPEFRERVLTLIRAHAPDLDEPAVREKYSKGGRFLSITITVQATGREQLDAIYLALTACELVTMAL